jgi:hypothetical protein
MTNLLVARGGTLPCFPFAPFAFKTMVSAYKKMASIRKKTGGCRANNTIDKISSCAGKYFPRACK